MMANGQKTQVCIAGGGPAGILLGYLLARAGIHVVVLEKHRDFLRDFRGDTVHPSTLTVLRDCGLLDAFNALPQQREHGLAVRLGKQRHDVVDFTGLSPFDYLALVPQWDFLNLIAAEAATLPHFTLLMEHEVRSFVQVGDWTTGVHCRTPDRNLTINAEVVVACDGRGSRLRQQSQLPLRDLGAPMDAMWFRLPRSPEQSNDTFAIIGAGKIMVLLNRGDYWQTAFVVPKGADRKLREQPIEAFQREVVELAPSLEKASAAISDWKKVKTLVVEVNRLTHWCKPGLLCIGDAAHAMSPVGGVGINLAIQDAVAAANVIARAIKSGLPLDDHTLKAVQRRRLMPTRLTQMVQTQMQKRVISHALRQHDQAPTMPGWLSALLNFRSVRNIPARIIGYGFRQETVDTSLFEN